MKIKILLFGLFLIASLGLKAQEKYEYATLRSNGYDALSYTTTEKSEKIKVDSKENELALVKKVNELNEEGWELFLVSETGKGANVLFEKTYYLRRKK